MQVVERRGFPRDIVESAARARGARRSFFSRRETLEEVAGQLTQPTRTVSVVSDEEHDGFQLLVDDRRNGYPRHHMTASIS